MSKVDNPMTGAPATVTDPGRLRDLASAIARRELSPVELVSRSLHRIAAVDGAVQCWREVDGQRALAVAEVRAAEAAKGLLRGPLLAQRAAELGGLDVGAAGTVRWAP